MGSSSFKKVELYESVDEECKEQCKIYVQMINADWLTSNCPYASFYLKEQAFRR